MFWLYPLMYFPPNKFIKTLIDTLHNIPENKIMRIKEPRFHPGYCKCGYEGTMIDLRSITSSSYGRYAEGFYPASALTHTFLSKLNLVVILNRRMGIKGMKNIYPKYVNASFLIKDGSVETKEVLKSIVNTVKDVDEMKLIAYSKRYLSFLATDTIQASMKNIIYYPDRIVLF